ncbi:MAG: hypothetical protein H0U81_13680 [Pyrinomonadaceae bacterium]|nr:hypothetical protein [Pyrinomonadaceae bacterium]
MTRQLNCGLAKHLVFNPQSTIHNPQLTGRARSGYCQAASLKYKCWVMKKERLLVRNFQAGIYLESFLVAAVASVLVIRLFLQLTGYPQIGGGGLHIAHMLWGGLLMLAAMIILLSFLNRTAARVAAVAGGIGFGTFIDEVGKFVTSDNDYFFQPAVALIYVIFILIFMTIRAIHKERTYSSAEYLVNALKEMEEAALHNLDEKEKERALLYLGKCDPTDPLVSALKSSLLKVTLRPLPRAGVLTRIKQFAVDAYRYVAGLWWFPYLVMAFFVAQLAVTLVYVLILIFVVGLGWEQILSVRLFKSVAERTVNLSFVDVAQLAFSILSGAFVFCGVVVMRRSRIAALKWFERSILISIFLTQVFAFYKEQFSALLGLFFNIAVLLTLRFMIEHARMTLSSAAVKPSTLTYPRTSETPTKA